jgi:hypothetical protein
MDILYAIMASIPAEVEGRPQKMAASISSAGDPYQKKNHGNSRKEIRLELYLKRSLNIHGPDWKKNIFEVDSTCMDALVSA